MDTYLLSLGHEYIETITSISSGMYSGDTLRWLEQQRGVIHDQLIDAIGKYIPRNKMPQYVMDNIL